jgi:hypothetical protein
VTSYTTARTPPTNTVENKPSENNAKAMNAILCRLSKSEFVKAMHCESTNDIWDKIQNIYEVDDKVKKEKLQTHRRQFECLKMKDKESG